MSRKGNCWDIAVAESFFSSLKKERIKKKIYKTRKDALADITDYIKSFYNPFRRHSHLHGVSPNSFEAATNGRQKRGVHQIMGTPNQHGRMVVAARFMQAELYGPRQ
jgi:hypothetical protein